MTGKQSKVVEEIDGGGDSESISEMRRKTAIVQLLRCSSDASP
jgi:hypothetical protein